MAKSQRIELGNILRTVLGSNNIYFQPGPDVTMQYPAIVYERDTAWRNSANNSTYLWKQRYQVTFLTYDPDSDVIDKLMMLPLCAYDRHFATSGLNHDVFVIYH